MSFPSDNISLDNICIMTQKDCCTAWALLCDPQRVAVHWIEKLLQDTIVVKYKVSTVSYIYIVDSLHLNMKYLSRGCQTVTRESHAALCPVSCSSYIYIELCVSYRFLIHLSSIRYFLVKGKDRGGTRGDF